MKRPYSKRAIIKELEELIECERSSFSERDGVIRDARARRTIAKLEDAIDIIKQHKAEAVK